MGNEPGIQVNLSIRLLPHLYYVRGIKTNETKKKKTNLREAGAKTPTQTPIIGASVSETRLGGVSLLPVPLDCCAPHLLLGYVI